MADFKAKQITSLTENTSMDDADTVPVGAAGTSILRRVKWSNILSAIKNKITSWTYSFNTSSKTLEGAVNEMQGNISAINGSLANKVDSSALQSAFEGNWYPNNLPSGFNSTDKTSMASLKNGWYWHSSEDGTLNFPSAWGFMVKFGFVAHGDFSALFFTQASGTIYRCSGNGQTISGWVAV